jgi:hypothetical protein
MPTYEDMTRKPTEWSTMGGSTNKRRPELQPNVEALAGKRSTPDFAEPPEITALRNVVTSPLVTPLAQIPQAARGTAPSHAQVARQTLGTTPPVATPAVTAHTPAPSGPAFTGKMLSGTNTMTVGGEDGSARTISLPIGAGDGGVNMTPIQYQRSTGQDMAAYDANKQYRDLTDRAVAATYDAAANRRSEGGRGPLGDTLGPDEVRNLINLAQTQAPMTSRGQYGIQMNQLGETARHNLNSEDILRTGNAANNRTQIDVANIQAGAHRYSSDKSLEAAKVSSAARETTGKNRLDAFALDEFKSINDRLNDGMPKSPEEITALNDRKNKILQGIAGSTGRAAPTWDGFLSEMRKKGSKLSDADLRAYYNENYVR